MLNSKEVVIHSLKGSGTTRVASGPLATHFCTKMTGVTISEYTSNPRLLAESVIRYYERFRPDAVWVSADTWVSAEAMGARVGATGSDQPYGGLGSPLIQTAGDIARIPRPDPGSQGRWPLMIEALRRVVEALGKDVFVVACFDQYPFSLAAALMGINEIMMKTVDDRSMVNALMERCLEYALSYACALGDVGADMLSGGNSPAGLMGPRGYREIALPFDKRLIAGVKEHACQPISLHICGDALPILTDMAGSGADVLEIDYKVDLAEACRIVGPNIVLWGNLDPVGVLAHGTASRVRQTAQEVLETVNSCRHKRFVLSSGCTLAMETPFENLDAMLSVKCRYGNGFIYK